MLGHGHSSSSTALADEGGKPSAQYASMYSRVAWVMLAIDIAATAAPEKPHAARTAKIRRRFSGLQHGSCHSSSGVNAATTSTAGCEIQSRTAPMKTAQSSDDSARPHQAAR